MKFFSIKYYANINIKIFVNFRYYRAQIYFAYNSFISYVNITIFTKNFCIYALDNLINYLIIEYSSMKVIIFSKCLKVINIFTNFFVR